MYDLDFHPFVQLNNITNIRVFWDYQTVEHIAYFLICRMQIRFLLQNKKCYLFWNLEDTAAQ